MIESTDYSWKEGIQTEWIWAVLNTEIDRGEEKERRLNESPLTELPIKKGEKKLFEYEEKLLFMKKTMNQEKQIENILAQLNKIHEDSSDEKVNNILEEVKKELNCLV